MMKTIWELVYEVLIFLLEMGFLCVALKLVLQLVCVDQAGLS